MLTVAQTPRFAQTISYIDGGCALQTTVGQMERDRQRNKMAQLEALERGDLVEVDAMEGDAEDYSTQAITDRFNDRFSATGTRWGEDHTDYIRMTDEEFMRKRTRDQQKIVTHRKAALVRVSAEAYAGIYTAAMSSLLPCSVASPRSFNTGQLLDALHV